MEDYYIIDKLTRAQFVDYLTEQKLKGTKYPREACDLLFLKAIGNKPVLAYLIISSMNTYEYMTVSQIARAASVDYEKEITSGNALAIVGNILKALSALDIVETTEIKDSMGRNTIGYRLNKFRNFYAYVTANSIRRWSEKSYLFPNLMSVFEHFNRILGKVIDKNGRLTDLRLEVLFESLINSGISVQDAFETLTYVSMKMRDGISTKELQDIVSKVLETKDPTHMLAQRYRRVSSGVIILRESNEILRFSHIRERIRAKYPELKSKHVDDTSREVMGKLRLLGFRHISEEFLDAVISEQIESYSSINDLVYAKNMLEEAIKADDWKRKARYLVTAGRNLATAIISANGEPVPANRDHIFSQVQKNAKKYAATIELENLSHRLLALSLRTTFQHLTYLSTKLEFLEEADIDTIEEVAEHMQVLLDSFSTAS